MDESANLDRKTTEHGAEARVYESAPAPPYLSVASPCYNEEECIADVVHDWDKVLDGFDCESEIVLCNDGSTDRTRVILEDLVQSYPRLRVIELEQNGGYGRALSAAIHATRGRYIATIDSDGQFDLSDAKRLLQVAEETHCDLVTGFRHKKEDTPIRVLANHGLNLLVRLLFGVRLRDTNCALKLARAEALRELQLESSSFATPTEICLRVNAGGVPVQQVGVSHRARPQGHSKINTASTAWDLFRYLVYLRIKIFLYRAGILNGP